MSKYLFIHIYLKHKITWSCLVKLWDCSDLSNFQHQFCILHQNPVYSLYAFKRVLYTGLWLLISLYQLTTSKFMSCSFFFNKYRICITSIFMTVESNRELVNRNRIDLKRYPASGDSTWWQGFLSRNKCSKRSKFPLAMSWRSRERQFANVNKQVWLQEL